MSARRCQITQARADEAARGVTSFMLVEGGPEEGQFSYNRSLRGHVAQLRFRDGVYDGVDADEGEAKSRAVAIAAELTGLPLWQVQDAVYGDADGAAEW